MSCHIKINNIMDLKQLISNYSKEHILNEYIKKYSPKNPIFLQDLPIIIDFLKKVEPSNSDYHWLELRKSFASLHEIQFPNNNSPVSPGTVPWSQIINLPIHSDVEDNMSILLDILYEITYYGPAFSLEQAS